VVRVRVFGSDLDVRFGDDSTKSFPPGSVEPFETHDDAHLRAWSVRRRRHRATSPEKALRRVLRPGRDPVRATRPAFALNISNSASGIGRRSSTFPPVVTSPAAHRERCQNGTLIPADAVGQTHLLLWPRRAPLLTLSAGGHREGGIRALGRRCDRWGQDDRHRLPLRRRRQRRLGRNAHRRLPPDVPIAIQWDTPLPNAGSYPVQLTLDLQTTYDNGAVRTSTVSGTVGVTSSTQP